MPSKDANIAKKELHGETSRVKDSIVLPDQYLSFGISLLNLGTTGHHKYGLRKGRVYQLCGRSSGGKTWVAHSILAEASINPNFDGYELIYDDVERGANMEVKRYFGSVLADRLVPPARNKKKEPLFSKYTSDFYRRVNTRLDKGGKFIWIEDSLDALNPDKETKMGDGKAKMHSQELRKLIDGLEATGSILLLVSQAKVDIKSMFGEDTTSGGRSLEFYSTVSIWLRKTKTLKTTYKGIKIPMGHIIQARIKKNRISGQDRTVYFPFHNTYGLDDIGANIDFLTSYKHWEKDKDGVIAKDFALHLPREKLISHIEKAGWEEKLQLLTSKTWKQIDKASQQERKARYI